MSEEGEPRLPPEEIEKLLRRAERQAELDASRQEVIAAKMAARTSRMTTDDLIERYLRREDEQE